MKLRVKGVSKLKQTKVSLNSGIIHLSTRHFHVEPCWSSRYMLLFHALLLSLFLILIV